MSVLNDSDISILTNSTSSCVAFVKRFFSHSIKMLSEWPNENIFAIFSLFSLLQHTILEFFQVRLQQIEWEYILAKRGRSGNPINL